MSTSNTDSTGNTPKTEILLDYDTRMGGFRVSTNRAGDNEVVWGGRVFNDPDMHERLLSPTPDIFIRGWGRQMVEWLFPEAHALWKLAHPPRRHRNRAYQAPKMYEIWRAAEIPKLSNTKEAVAARKAAIQAAKIQAIEEQARVAALKRERKERIARSERIKERGSCFADTIFAATGIQVGRNACSGDTIGDREREALAFYYAEKGECAAGTKEAEIQDDDEEEYEAQNWKDLHRVFFEVLPTNGLKKVTDVFEKRAVGKLDNGQDMYEYDVVGEKVEVAYSHISLKPFARRDYKGSVHQNNTAHCVGLYEVIFGHLSHVEFFMLDEYIRDGSEAGYPPEKWDSTATGSSLRQKMGWAAYLAQIVMEREDLRYMGARDDASLVTHYKALLKQYGKGLNAWAEVQGECYNKIDFTTTPFSIQMKDPRVLHVEASSVEYETGEDEAPLRVPDGQTYDQMTDRMIIYRCLFEALILSCGVHAVRFDGGSGTAVPFTPPVGQRTRVTFTPPTMPGAYPESSMQKASPPAPTHIFNNGTGGRVEVAVALIGNDRAGWRY